MGYITSMKNTEQKIIEAYKPNVTSLRDVASVCGTDHHRVKRVLDAHNIEIVKAKAKPLSSEHRRKIGEKSKGRKPNLGKKMPKTSLYKNMAAHIRFDVTSEWLSEFSDIEKLKFLNYAITRRGGRFELSTDDYIEYIERFYDDRQFNDLYFSWIISQKNKWLRPTIDHINPRANGGCNRIENLQFLTWFENRAKCDMTQDEWNNVKANIKDYLV